MRGEEVRGSRVGSAGPPSRAPSRAQKGLPVMDAAPGMQRAHAPLEEMPLPRHVQAPGPLGRGSLEMGVGSHRDRSGRQALASSPPGPGRPRAKPSPQHVPAALPWPLSCSATPTPHLCASVPGPCPPSPPPPLQAYVLPLCPLGSLRGPKSGSGAPLGSISAHVPAPSPPRVWSAPPIRLHPGRGQDLSQSQ